MDNDHRTAMDLASLNDRHDIVSLLDQACASEKQKNTKSVRKLQETAVLEADKRGQEFDKRQRKYQEKLKTKEMTSLSANGNKTGSFYKTVTNKIFRDPVKEEIDPSQIPVMPSRNGQVLMRPKEKNFNDAASVVSDKTYKTDSGYGDEPNYFPIPHQLAFRKNIRAVDPDSLYSIAPSRNRISEEDESIHEIRAQSTADSLGSTGSYTRGQNDWDINQVELSDDDENDEEDNVRLFLTGSGFGKYYPLFQKEHIDDMETLLLLTDVDLEKLGLELGPRKKLMQMILKYKVDTETPADITDSRL